MRLMLTRAKADAADTLDQLRSADQTVLHEPLLTILPGPDADAVAAVVLDGVQALLATSSNGVRAMASWPEALRIPLYAVGDATARTARELGFNQVDSADGDVGTLSKLVKAKLKPAGGPVVHGAGTVRAGDLAGDLEAAGFQVRRLALYKAETAAKFTSPAEAFLKADKPGGVLLYSPRTAATFAALVKKAGLQGKLGHITAYCLSPAVSQQLQGLGLGGVAVAEAPREDKLLALLDKQALLLTQQPATTDNVAQKGSVSKGNTMADQKPASPSTGSSAAPKVAAKPTGAAASKPAQKSGGKPDVQPIAQKPKKPGRAGWMVAGALVLVMAGGVGTIAGLPYVPENIKDRIGLGGSDDGAAAMMALENRMASLERRASRPQVSSTTDATTADALRGVTAELEALSTRLVLLEAAPDPLPDTTATDALRAEFVVIKTRLAALESLVADMASSPAPQGVALDDADLAARMEAIAYAASAGKSAALLSFAALERATVSSPFRAELDAMIATTGGGDALSSLVPYADQGVMSHQRLKGGFDRLAREAVRAAMVPDDAPWYERWLANAMSIVTVRPVGDVPGGDVPARVARAEAALGDDDLAGAVREVAAIDGAAGQLLADWLGAAQARLAVDEAMAVVRAQVMSAGS